MKYSSGNHRRGTGRTVQRESKQAWLDRRIAEEAHVVYLLSTPDSELTDGERQEKSMKATWRRWTEEQLKAFIGI